MQASSWGDYLHTDVTSYTVDRSADGSVTLTAYNRPHNAKGKTSKMIITMSPDEATRLADRLLSGTNRVNP